MAIVVSSDADCSHIQLATSSAVVTAKRSALTLQTLQARDLVANGVDFVINTNESHARYLNLAHCSIAHSSRTLVDLAWVSIRC